MRVHRGLAVVGGAAVAVTAAVVPVVVAHAGGAPTVALYGTVAGTYRPISGNPEAGKQYSVSARGSTSIGTTKATGTVHGIGNIRSGHCTATVTFTTSKGSISTSVTSTKTFGSFAACQSGFAFGWRVVKGTGSYSGHTGSGKGTLTLVAPGNASTNPPPAYITLDKA